MSVGLRDMWLDATSEHGGASNGTADAVRQRVATYYDRMQVFYSWFWSRTGVHYGFWERGTWRRAEAVRNMDRLAAAELALPPGARVLDAGCGVGGTSVYLAEQHDLDVVGITISEVQLRRARQLAAGCRAAVLPRFLIRDYLCTGFETGAFDGVIAIESACYAQSKMAFLSEAFRLLRPGGRLVVMDGFRRKWRLTRRERLDFERFTRGLALSGLAHVDEFTAYLRGIGFGDIRYADKRSAILPSAVIMEAMTRVGVPLVGPACRLGILPRLWLDHGLAGVSQRRLFQSGTLAYGVFVATKG